MLAFNMESQLLIYACLGALLLIAAMALGRIGEKGKEKLRDAENLKELALWGGGLGIWEYDILTDELVVDSRFKEIAGQTSDSMGPDLKSWLPHTHPEDIPSLSKKINDLLAEITPSIESEHRYQGEDGVFRWLIVKGQITERDSDWKPLKAAGTLQNIDARRGTELRLAESEKSFRSLVENLGDLILRFNSSCRCVYASPAARHMTGTEPKDCIGKTHGELLGIEGSQNEYLESFIRQVFESGRPAEQEFDCKGRQDWLQLNWRLFPEFGKDGNVSSVFSITRDLTGRKEAEHAYKSIFENMIDGFAIHEIIIGNDGSPEDYRFLSVNPAFESITGLKAEKILGRTAREVIPGLDRKWIEKYAEVAFTGKSAHFTDYSAEFGKTFEVMAYRTALGKFACMVRDVSGIADARERLDRQMKLMQMILDGIPDMALLLKPDHSIAATNKASLEFMGWDASEIADMKCFSLLGFSSPCPGCPLDEALATSSTSVRNIDSPETGLCFEMRTMPIPGKPGEPPELFVEIIRNITDKRDMEVDLDRMIDSLQAEILSRMKAEDALRRNKQLYRLIAESAQVGIWQLDIDGRIQFLNPTMEKLIQCSDQKEIEDLTCFDFIPAKSVKSLAYTEKPPGEGNPGILNSYEAELVGLKGGRRDVMVSGIATFALDSPRPETYIETFVDLTEIRRAEKEEEARKIKLMQAEKMASLGVLVSGVAHEINNPTNFIMLNAPILLDVWKSSVHPLERHAAENPDFSLAGIPYDEMKELVPQLFQSVFDGADRIKGIVSGLKDYARQEISDPSASCDVNEAVKAAVLLLSNMVRKTTNKFNVSYGEGLPPVKGSRQRIEQVVINLVQNSCQALRGHDDSIEVSTSFENSKVRIVVRDEGAGISKENMPFITDPFFTTKRESGGTGLGLSISSGTINDMGGELTFDSIEGSGTKATISLLPSSPELGHKQSS